MKKYTQWQWHTCTHEKSHNTQVTISMFSVHCSAFVSCYLQWLHESICVPESARYPPPTTKFRPTPHQWPAAFAPQRAPTPWPVRVCGHGKRRERGEEEQEDGLVGWWWLWEIVVKAEVSWMVIGLVMVVLSRGGRRKRGEWWVASIECEWHFVNHRDHNLPLFRLRWDEFVMLFPDMWSPMQKTSSYKADKKTTLFMHDDQWMHPKR